jgi:hypothetical protein
MATWPCNELQSPPPDEVIIELPGAIEISSIVDPSTWPDLCKMIGALQVQLYATIPPLNVIMRLIDCFFKLKQAAEAIPKAITNLDPAGVAEKLAEMAVCISYLRIIVPQISFYKMLIDFFLYMLRMFDCLRNQLEAIERQLADPLSLLQVSIDTGDSDLDSSSNCAIKNITISGNTAMAMLYIIEPLIDSMKMIARQVPHTPPAPKLEDLLDDLLPVIVVLDPDDPFNISNQINSFFTQTDGLEDKIALVTSNRASVPELDADPYRVTPENQTISSGNTIDYSASLHWTLSKPSDDLTEDTFWEVTDQNTRTAGILSPGAVNIVVANSSVFPTSGYPYAIIIGSGTNTEAIQISNNNTTTNTLTTQGPATIALTHASSTLVRRVVAEISNSTYISQSTELAAQETAGSATLLVKDATIFPMNDRPGTGLDFMIRLGTGPNAEDLRVRNLVEQNRLTLVSPAVTANTHETDAPVVRIESFSPVTPWSPFTIKGRALGVAPGTIIVRGNLGDSGEAAAGLYHQDQTNLTVT